MTSRILVASLLAFLLLLAGCSEDATEPNTPAGPVEAEIGPAGGTLDAGGGATLSVPAGALATTTTVTLEKLEGADLPAPLAAAGATQAWRIGPDGVAFQQPAVLTEVLPTAKAEHSVPAAVGVTVNQDDLELLDGSSVQYYDETVDVRLSYHVDGASISSSLIVGGFTFSNLPGTVPCEDLITPVVIDTAHRLDFNIRWLDETNQVVGNSLSYGGANPRDFGYLSWSEAPMSTTLGPYACTGEGDATIKGTAEFTQLNLPEYSLSDGVTEIEFTIGLSCPECGGGEQFVGSVESPVTQPELVAPARIGFAALGVLITLVLLVAGGNGFTVMNGASGLALATVFMVAGWLQWGALPLSYLLPDKDGEPQYHDAVLSFGPDGASLRAYYPDDPEPGWGWDQLLEFNEPVYDAAAFGNGPVTTGAVYATSWQVRTLVFDETNEVFAEDPALVLMNTSFPGVGGSFVSAYSDGADQPVLVAVDGTPGGVWIHLRDGGDATRIGDTGDDPRRVRAAGGVAAVSNFTSGTLTIVLLDGASSTIAGHVPVGDGPVGIDVLDLGDGTVGVFSTGFNDDTWTVTVIDASDGSVVSNVTSDVPGDCSAPGHATWLRDGSRRVVFSCNGSDDVVTAHSGL